MPHLSPLRIAPGGHYFETFDGESFLFIGPNDAVAWQGLRGLYRRRDVPSARAHLRSMADASVTILRLMLEYAHEDDFFFERPAGQFDDAMVQLWDDLFALCEEFGLRVLLAPWDNFWMTRRWKRHPYNIQNGGPAATRQSLFTDPNTIEFATRRLQFVVERWGANGAFAAWDLFNEIDPHWGGDGATQSAVIAAWSQAVRQKENELWGWTRPQTVSIFGPIPRDGYADLIFRDPNLDFATTHIYHREAIDHPRNTVASALSMARWTRYGRDETPANRPFTDSEHGPIALFNNHRKMLPEEFDDEYERHMMWAHLSSGGAGSGMRWPSRHPHLLTGGTRRALSNLAAFSRLVDWRHFTPHDARELVKINARGVLVFAIADARQAVIWLLRGSPKRNRPGLLPMRRPLKNVSLTVENLTRGTYSIELWDTRCGSIGTLKSTVGDDGILRLQLPQLNNDLALAVRAD